MQAPADHRTCELDTMYLKREWDLYNWSFPIFLSKSKENATIAAFFSEAQFTLRGSGLPLVFILVLASHADVFLGKFGFYLMLKGF